MLSTKVLQLQLDSHAFLVAQSLGLDLAKVPLPRFLPMRVYLSNDDPDVVNSVTNAIHELAAAQGFTIADDIPADKGSSLKKWLAKTIDRLTQEEVEKCFDKAGVPSK